MSVASAAADQITDSKRGGGLLSVATRPEGPGDAGPRRVPRR